MSDFTNERSNSIIDTSLTELAFIFFFILLIFSAWKIDDITHELQSNTDDKGVLELEIKQLQETLKSASNFFNLEKEVSPEELFNELILGREAVTELEKTKEELDQMTSSLNEIIEVSSSNDIKEIAKEIKEIKEAKEFISEKGLGEGTITETLENIVKESSDTKGQNKNLRNKIKTLGNGLDHPPCWADEETGAIQYVFNVIINEDSIEVLEGWPEKRRDEALANANIHSVIGSYASNSMLWGQSNALFKESITNECRHVVRIFDHAESKTAFKNYLSGIESHFYKYLRNDRYAK